MMPLAPPLPSPTAATADPLRTAAGWQAELGGIRVRFGRGCRATLGGAATELGATRALVVTDPGVAAAGHAEDARRRLIDAGIPTEVFADVVENPTTIVVEAGVGIARDAGIDLLVAVGGGSALDTAKGINFLLTQGGSMADYWGDGKATEPMLPSIGLPTTAGTGSEAQRFALITDPESHRKMACGSRQARFRFAFLDPEPLATLPRDVAALTAVDAISHAVESHVSRRANPVSRLYSRAAWAHLERHVDRFLADRGDATAGAGMLLGAHLSGAAIEASMLGAAHSTANPLTARYDIVHGQAVGVMLPRVVRFNEPAAADLYDELADEAGLVGPGSGAERLARRLEAILEGAGLETTLRGLGIDDDALGTLAEDAAREWTARFNPRDVGPGDFLTLYRDAYR